MNQILVSSYRNTGTVQIEQRHHHNGLDNILVSTHDIQAVQGYSSYSGFIFTRFRPERELFCVESDSSPELIPRRYIQIRI